MSRVGKQPIPIPTGVTVQVAGGQVDVKGAKGSLSWGFPASVQVAYDVSAKRVQVTRAGDTRQDRADHGLTRALIANMVKGVSDGFEKRLQIYGTGYNCKLAGHMLHLNVGFSGRRRGLGSQFEIPVPPGVEVVVEKDAARGETDPAQILIRGCDKQAVGEFAAEVRAIRKTEPYKGKGIRYQGEYVRRKQGKTLTGGGGG
jgi:large subunit ribosomal protein L6